MSESKTNLSVWKGSVVILSLLLFFFAVPHTLEDFALGEPAKNGVPAAVLSFVVAGMFALQGLALFWPLAAGIAQLPVILVSSNYRSGFISLAYVTGMIAIGILLFLASLQALKIDGKAQGKE
jgi:hypothetical protein